MERKQFIKKIKYAFRVNPVVAILGPRQCGKTTIAKKFASAYKNVTYLDLEKPQDLARLESPMLALEELVGLIVIDEIQRREELFPVLRVLIDQHKKRRFLILGSASRELIRQSSETLAGRISYLELTPFTYQETNELKKLWIRGGFPKSYLAKSESISLQWRNDYIMTFLEKDLPNLGIQIPPKALRRFWMMITHYHGNIFNASEIGKALGIAHNTVRRYLDILTGTLMIRELQPWWENINKRQIKSPKIYFRDSGIFHALLGIADWKSLHHHPKIGASWEGAAVEEIIRYHNARPEETYFWGIHSDSELDLLILKDGQRIGFEIKYTDNPKFTSSMKKSIDFLKLDKLTLIFPGKENFILKEKVRAIGLESYLASKKSA